MLVRASVLVNVVACPDTGIRSRARDPDSDVAAHTRLTEMHKYVKRMLAILSADGERELYVLLATVLGEQHAGSAPGLHRMHMSGPGSANRGEDADLMGGGLLARVPLRWRRFES